MGTRRDWTADEKLNIVLEAIKTGNVSEVCRRHQLSPTLFQRWREEALAGAKQGLLDKRKPANRDPVKEEVRKLQEMVGKQAMVLDAQKKLLGEPQR